MAVSQLMGGAVASDAMGAYSSANWTQTEVGSASLMAESRHEISSAVATDAGGRLDQLGAVGAPLRQPLFDQEFL